MPDKKRWHPAKLLEPTTISVILEAAVLKKLKEEAKRQGVSVAVIIRQYIDEGLNLDRK